MVLFPQGLPSRRGHRPVPGFPRPRPLPSLLGDPANPARPRLRGDPCSLASRAPRQLQGHPSLLSVRRHPGHPWAPGVLERRQTQASPCSPAGRGTPSPPSCRPHHRCLACPFRPCSPWLPWIPSPLGSLFLPSCPGSRWVRGPRAFRGLRLLLSLREDLASHVLPRTQGPPVAQEALWPAGIRRSSTLVPHCF